MIEMMLSLWSVIWCTYFGKISTTFNITDAQLISTKLHGNPNEINIGRSTKTGSLAKSMDDEKNGHTCTMKRLMYIMHRFSRMTKKKTSTTEE